MALYDAKGKELHMKIRREGDRRFQPRWLLAGMGLLVAAFGLSLFWQRVQQTPIEVVAVSHEAVLVPQPPAEPIVVGGREALPAEPEAPAVPEVDFSVRYQVPASDPVGDGYFDDALFVGDSITTGITLYHTMSGADVVAATGINPNTVLDKPVIRDADGNLHTMLDAMRGKSPAKIYLLLGANGIAWIDRPTFTERYAALLDAIQAQHPDALLYVQSIFPVTREKSLGENGAYSNEKIDEYNQAIMELCEERGLPYLNVAEALKKPDGALAPGASADGIHVGPAYYEKWFDYLRTHTTDKDQKVTDKGDAI